MPDLSQIASRAQAPEPAVPGADQAVTTGHSGRRSLSERPPLRTLGPVLCTGRVFSSSHRLAARGPLVVLGPWGERTSRSPRRLQASMPSRAVVCGQP